MSDVPSKPPFLLPRETTWRMHYQARRYARHLSQSELNRRIADVMGNLIILTDQVKVGLLPPTGDGPRWMELFTHLLEEMRLRHGLYPHGFSRDAMPRISFPDLVGELGRKAVAAARKSKASDPSKLIIKYGKAQHMKALHEQGVLRIQPASYFAAPTHNGAVRDDELSIPLSLVLTRDDIVKLVRNPEQVPADAKEQRLDLSLRFESDYWLYCVSMSTDPRLFVDFASNACVVIRDQGAFTERLFKHSQPALADATGKHGAATYVDPLLPTTVKVTIPLAKHFRYSYQREYRFYWLPPMKTPRVHHVDLTLGSLEDISELVML